MFPESAPVLLLPCQSLAFFLDFPVRGIECYKNCLPHRILVKFRDTKGVRHQESVPMAGQLWWRSIGRLRLLVGRKKVNRLCSAKV